MAAEVFILIGTIIFLGFAAQALFERTKVPDVLLLMLFGVLIGPLDVVGKLTGARVVDTALFTSIAPVIGVIALIILLFNGGFNLDLFKVFTELSTAAWFTLLIFLLTTLLTAAVLVPFGWPFLHGLLLGAIIGGTSSATVMSLLSKSSAADETKTLLTLESALTDALCVVAAIVLIEVLGKAGGLTLDATANFLLGQFSIAAMVAIAVSLFWIKILQRFKELPFSYMLSLAVMFLMYGFVESVKASGVISVLVFALMLGNWNSLAKKFSLGDEIIAFDKIFRSFQEEVTFFVRTFFFVYMGIVFNVFALAGNLQVLLPITAVLAMLGIARFIGTKTLSAFTPQFSKDGLLVFSMMPRDLAAAVLATLPQTRGITLPFISEIVFLTIILTNIVTAVGFYKSENAGKAGNKNNATNGKGNSGENASKPRIVRQT